MDRKYNTDDCQYYQNSTTDASPYCQRQLCSSVNHSIDVQLTKEVLALLGGNFLTVELSRMFFFILELRCLHLYVLSIHPLDASTTHMLNNYKFGIMLMSLLLYIILLLLAVRCISLVRFCFSIMAQRLIVLLVYSISSRYNIFIIMLQNHHFPICPDNVVFSSLYCNYR